MAIDYKYILHLKCNIPLSKKLSKILIFKYKRLKIGCVFLNDIYFIVECKSDMNKQTIH